MITTMDSIRRIWAANSSAVCADKIVELMEKLAEAEKDSRRLDDLQRWAMDDKSGNGIAVFPFTRNRSAVCEIALQELGDEDGSSLGDELSTGASLRAAIDDAQPAEKGSDHA